MARDTKLVGHIETVLHHAGVKESGTLAKQIVEEFVEFIEKDESHWDMDFLLFKLKNEVSQ